jgi:hypothetical protein
MLMLMSILRKEVVLGEKYVLHIEYLDIRVMDERRYIYMKYRDRKSAEVVARTSLTFHAWC